jgi:Co/Zn/Cd efflux system component
MSEPIRINATLAALLSSAVLAWAGLVWGQSSRILELTQEIHADLRKLEERQKNHEDATWAHDIKSHVVDSEKMINVTRSRLERLERDHLAMEGRRQ